MEDASVSVSVAFNDNQTRKQFEADTIDTEVRIGALRKLRANGIATSALVCPVVPYITDVTPLIHMLAPHTDTIWIYGLSVVDRLDRNWQSLQGILQRHFPDLKEQIETALFYKEHPYREKLRQDLYQLQKDHGLNLKIRL
jgi:DNA repair photolyase